MSTTTTHKGKPPVKADFIKRRLARFPSETYDEVNAAYTRETFDTISPTTFRKVRDEIKAEDQATSNADVNGTAKFPGIDTPIDITLNPKDYAAIQEAADQSGKFEEAEAMLDELIYVVRGLSVEDPGAILGGLRVIRRMLILDSLREG